jgi:hypothetical protein
MEDMMQGHIGSLYGTEIYVSPFPMVDTDKSGYSVLESQRNPLFFWEPLPKPRMKRSHYFIQAQGSVFMDEITFSQLKKELNDRNIEEKEIGVNWRYDFGIHPNNDSLLASLATS